MSVKLYITSGTCSAGRQTGMRPYCAVVRFTCNSQMWVKREEGKERQAVSLSQVTRIVSKRVRRK